MTRDAAQLRAFAVRYTEAWCSMDPARVAGHFAPGGSLTINDGPPSVGRSAITEAARGFYVALPDMQVLMDDLIVDGDRIEFHWTFTGTNTGPGGTGNAVRVSGFEECLRHNEMELALDELEDLGLTNAPPPEFWRQLVQAAENMGLSERATDFERRMGKA